MYILLVSFLFHFNLINVRIQLFQKHRVNLHHIESRPSKQDKALYAFFVSCDNKTGGLKEAIQELKEKSTTFSILSRDSDKDASKTLVLSFFSNKSCIRVSTNF